jgi:transposase
MSRGRSRCRLPGLQEPAKKALALATLDREWDGLIAHRDYPMVSLDSNVAGRQIRGPIVTRKNAGGSHTWRYSTYWHAGSGAG